MIGFEFSIYSLRCFNSPIMKEEDKERMKKIREILKPSIISKSDDTKQTPYEI